MASPKEIWKKMINEMDGDSEITDVIGSSNIHRSNPSVKLSFPALIIDVTLGVVSELSGIGLYRPQLTFNVYSADHDDADEIMRALEVGWQIPHNRPAGIETSNYKITQMRFENLIEVGRAEVISTAQVVIHFVIPASLRLISFRD